MGAKSLRRAAGILSIVLFLPFSYSCSSTGVPEKSGQPGQSPVEDPAKHDNRLEDPVFAKLPRELKQYLAELSVAFEKRDAAFLLAQGDAMFEKQVKPEYDDDEYLAMMYRIDNYAADKPLAPDTVPKLDVSRISHIEYSGWTYGDPAMEIRGRIYYTDKTYSPCIIMLFWKLDEPKITGWYP